MWCRSRPPGGRPPGARAGVFQKLTLTNTWLAWGGGDDLGINSLDLRTVLAFPFPTEDSPLIVTPGFGVHYLDGPVTVDLPPRLYDAYVQFRWMRQFTPRFGFDAAVTPGVYSDFQKGNDEALRIFTERGERFKVELVHAIAEGERCRDMSGVMESDSAQARGPEEGVPRPPEQVLWFDGSPHLVREHEIHLGPIRPCP